MTNERIADMLNRFADHHVAVVGDLFLDRYLAIEPAYEEISIETGKPAHQITGRRAHPGAAGTVCNNLTALGVGTVSVVAVIGDDGEGYELIQACKQQGITPRVVQSAQRFTPTYCKPMRQLGNGQEEEMERLDTKNRSPLPADLEDQVIAELVTIVGEVDAIIVADQVQERNCGVITDRVRAFLCELAAQNPQTIFFADSRERIGEFHQVTVKPNRLECTRAMNPQTGEAPSTDEAIQAGRELMQQTGKPVFLTLDAEGICPIGPDGHTQLPCPPVEGPIDIVGAGDSVTAGIVSALCSGASLNEAAIIGNLVASITIRQLGTTGTASPAQVNEAWQKHQDRYAPYLEPQA